MSRRSEHATVLPCRLLCLNVITSAVRHRFCRRRFIHEGSKWRKIHSSERAARHGEPALPAGTCTARMREDTWPGGLSESVVIAGVRDSQAALSLRSDSCGSNLTSHFSAHVWSCHPLSSWERASHRLALSSPLQCRIHAWPSFNDPLFQMQFQLLLYYRSCRLLRLSMIHQIWRHKRDMWCALKARCGSTLRRSPRWSQLKAAPRNAKCHHNERKLQHVFNCSSLFCFLLWCSGFEWCYHFTVVAGLNT